MCTKRNWLFYTCNSKQRYRLWVWFMCASNFLHKISSLCFGYDCVWLIKNLKWFLYRSTTKLFSLQQEECPSDVVSIIKSLFHFYSFSSLLKKRRKNWQTLACISLFFSHLSWILWFFPHDKISLIINKKTRTFFFVLYTYIDHTHR